MQDEAKKNILQTADTLKRLAEKLRELADSAAAGAEAYTAFAGSNENDFDAQDEATAYGLMQDALEQLFEEVAALAGDTK